MKDRDIIKDCVHRLGYAQAGEGLVVRISQRVFDPLFWLFQRLAITHHLVAMVNGQVV